MFHCLKPLVEGDAGMGVDGVEVNASRKEWEWEWDLFAGPVVGGSVVKMNITGWRHRYSSCMLTFWLGH
jgi:hypothetical protein